MQNAIPHKVSTNWHSPQRDTHRQGSADKALLAPSSCDSLPLQNHDFTIWLPHLVPKGSLDEAEQHFISLPGFFGFGLIDDAHHLIDALREQSVPLHLVDVVPVLVTFSSPNGHTV